MAGHVLVVDPSADGRSYLTHVLGSRGYRVGTAGDLVSARRAVRAEAPRAVIAAAAPGPGGAALVEGLARDPLLARCGVLAVTPAPLDPAARLGLLRAGAVDVLEGPLDRRFLGARLRALGRPRSVAEELALRDETTRALGLAEGPGLSPPIPGRIAVHASDPARAREVVAALAPHLADRLLDAADPAAAAADVALLLPGHEDDLDALAALRARLQEPRLLAVLPDARGDDAARALDLGADDVAGAADHPAEIAHRLRALVRQAQDRARCKARLADGLASAHRDALTGLWNRAYAEPHLARLAESAAAARQPLAVLMLDLDHFKAVNDRWGHPAGDAVLAEVARRLGTGLRVADLLARFGGEEFLIALPGAAPAQARAVAERLCAAVAAAPVRLPDGGALGVTVSIGVAQMAPGAAPDGPALARRLVAAADRALYRSKADGRARVTADA